MNKVIIVFLNLLLISCKLNSTSQEKIQEINNPENSILIPGEPLELLEENTPIIEVFRMMALESDDVYGFLKNKVSVNYTNFCNDFKNKIAIIDLEANNLIITQVAGVIYRFNDEGDLLDWANVKIFKEVFENEEIKNFNFIEEEGAGTYSIRIETEKLCAL